MVEYQRLKKKVLYDMFVWQIFHNLQVIDKSACLHLVGHEDWCQHTTNGMQQVKFFPMVVNNEK